jgi:bifunctional DNA-binding transcriptional regulator/antitoxin component of YhaV-PrlF toxin-antitoxin module
MKTTYQLQVGRRGVITFPKELRDQNNIADGEILNLIKLSENVFVISRHHSQVDEVANKLAQEWQDSGESLESMLTTLREVRAEYDEKKLYQRHLRSYTFRIRWRASALQAWRGRSASTHRRAKRTAGMRRGRTAQGTSNTAVTGIPIGVREG